MLHFANSPLVAEAIALREAIVFAASLNIQKILLESDCLILVNACRGEMIRKEIDHIISDIKFFKNNFTSCGILWVNRSCNTVANMVAKLKSINDLSRNWAIEPPSSRVPKIVSAIRFEEVKRCDKEKGVFNGVAELGFMSVCLLCCAFIFLPF